MQFSKSKRTALRHLGFNADHDCTTRRVRVLQAQHRYMYMQEQLFGGCHAAQASPRKSSSSKQLYTIICCQIADLSCQASTAQYIAVLSGAARLPQKYVPIRCIFHNFAPVNWASALTGPRRHDRQRNSTAAQDAKPRVIRATSRRSGDHRDVDEE